MATLVEQIQRDAADPNVSVATLLQRVNIVSVKLKLDVVEDWVDHELKGYPGDVPDYRKVFGSLRAHNPLRGWIGVLGNARVIETFSTV